jgi:hypothetical protein
MIKSPTRSLVGPGPGPSPGRDRAVAGLGLQGQHEIDFELEFQSLNLESQDRAGQSAQMDPDSILPVAWPSLPV